MIEYLVPAVSTYAAHIDRLFDWITYLVGFWFLLVLGYFFYLIFRYRERKGHKAQYVTGETHKQKLAIEVPHYLILVCDVVIIVMTFLVWYEVKIDLPPADKEVRVVAQQWAWTFYHPGADGDLGTEDDIPSVNKLHIEKDTVYHFYLESKDVMHSFSIPVFRLKQDAVPGRVIQGWFEANKTGEWDIQCAEMCGVAHGLMGARISIETKEDHAAWIAANTHTLASDSEMLAASEPNDSTSKEDLDNG